MEKQEYKKILRDELYGEKKANLINRFRIKYIQPNTNCIYLARRMWYLYNRGKFNKFRAKLIYLKIIYRYGCVIFPTAKVGPGFHIVHPVGIVLGNCTIGENFMIFQNCTIGNRGRDRGNPVIGNNVKLSTGSNILGTIKICDDVIIGANSLVIKDITEPGVYAGSPVKNIKK